ncbi:MAG: hypothetical protein JWO65_274 [Sphingomonas bacterium]|jgi:ElaB/YqjD/DUF883 family membrane-anchored ribosome-binding protein|nr:hypothetical protein [Sphingomonas bacterium]
MAEILPEGTDEIIPGASSTTPDDFNDATPPRNGGGAKPTIDDLKSSASEKASDFKTQASDKASAFAAQAGDKARDYAEQGKERASGALSEVARMIGNTAGTIDEKIGSGYGDYARRAADAVSGAADNLRDKDVEELIGDARDLVRKSPAIAIGAAAAAGFVLARLIKAGSDALDATAKAAAPRAETADVAETVTEAAKSPAKPRAKPASKA